MNEYLLSYTLFARGYTMVTGCEKCPSDNQALQFGYRNSKFGCPAKEMKKRTMTNMYHAGEMCG